MAGTVQITHENNKARDLYGNICESRQLVFTCTGDASDGSIPDTQISEVDFNFIDGWYLYRVKAYPISGGTAPDAASAFILDSTGLDLLGSEDGSTTPYSGLNLIHATLARTCLPNLYTPRAGEHLNYYPVINDLLTLKVIDQATNSADYAVVLTFI